MIGVLILMTFSTVELAVLGETDRSVDRVIFVVILIFYIMYYTRNRNPFWSIIAYIILYLCIMSDTNKNSKPLRCIAWNSRGMNAAKPYLNTLLKDNDIVVISEHQLFHEEIYKLKEICDVSDFQVYVKAKPKPILNTTRYTPGNCGIAIAWRKSIKYKVTPLKDINNDRMCVLMLHAYL